MLASHLGAPTSEASSYPFNTLATPSPSLFPTTRGEFRGQFTANPKKIRGHWIQPASINPYQQRYASPVVLSEITPGIWRGTVVPLQNRLSFYISIHRAEDGKLTAFIRNPEANFFSGRTYGVELSGDTLTLSPPTVPEQGTYDAQSDRLLIPLLDSYPPLAFARRKENEAIGFFPRMVPEKNKYLYRRPISESDGWSTASLSDVGMDAKKIEEFVEEILNVVPSPENPLNIQSLLIARHSKLVLEEYFYGFDKKRPHDMRSASKTIAPAW